MISPPVTFCGVPFADNAIDADVVVLGASNGTLYKPGTPSHAANAPTAVRRALDWFSVGRQQLDLDVGRALMGDAKVVDYGDVSTDETNSASNRQAITEASGRILAEGAIPILLGGDDSVPIPVFEAYACRDRRLTIVQVDAHIDWRNDIDGERLGYSSTMRRASEMSHVSDIIQIGARGPGSARESDLQDAKRWGSTFVTARDLHHNGLDRALAAIRAESDVFLSIDVDGLDPALMPGVILPAFGGVTYQQMLDLFEGVARQANIVGAAFVEYVPERDPTGVGAKAIARLVSCLISHIAPNAAP